MKKLFAILVVALFTMIGSNTVFAQQKPEEIAKIKVAELTEKLNLDGDQQRTLFRVFVKKEAAYAKSSISEADKKAVDEVFEKEVKAELTAEQFKAYQALE